MDLIHTFPQHIQVCLEPNQYWLDAVDINILHDSPVEPLYLGVFRSAVFDAPLQADGPHLPRVLGLELPKLVARAEE